MSSTGESLKAFDLRAAPMRIGKVRVKVRNLDQVSGFYQDVLGLQPLGGDGDRVTLGTASQPLLDLVGDPDLAGRDPRQAGLFHTAFLLPSRSDLANWLAFVAAGRIALHGASDHKVSEAIYLADPEGNGIEVYADRPRSQWRSAGGQLDMPSDPLDVQDLIEAASGGWAGMPEGGVIGHVHLQVGDTIQAEGFYRDVLGFDVTCRYPGGSFFGAGGYHHQLAANSWNSRGAGPRPDRMAGLDGFELVLRDGATRASIEARADEAGLHLSADGGTLRDPWGTAIALIH